MGSALVRNFEARCVDQRRRQHRHSGRLKDADFLKPEAIADTYWHLAHQDRSAWTMELEVRPFKEKF